MSNATTVHVIYQTEACTMIDHIAQSFDEAVKYVKDNMWTEGFDTPSLRTLVTTRVKETVIND